MKQVIPVRLGKESYSVEIERGLLDHVGPAIRALTKAEKAAVITDDNVAPLYADRLIRTLREAGFETRTFTMPHGEENKNVHILSSLWEDMAGFNLSRSDAVVTLSGGVPGDVGGFAASTYMRGIDWFQVPTSILAQIDSSVGGKTAIDLPQGKNLAGSFYQPRGVFIDPDLCKTLPRRYIHDGLAEAVKCGCIGDSFLFHIFETMNVKSLFSVLTEIIFRSVQLKTKLVEKDEYDESVRQLLNFGHTIGHALEGCTHYKQYTHGEAVAAGMMEMTRKTEALGYTEKGTAARLEAVLKKLGLPVEVKTPSKDLIPYMLKDKKRRGEEIHLIWLRTIGEAHIHSVAKKDLPQYIETAGDRKKPFTLKGLRHGRRH